MTGRWSTLTALLILIASCGASEQAESRTSSQSSSTGSGEAISRFPFFGEAEALAMSEPVRFRGADGIRLEGRLFGSGDVGIVLAHMRPGDQSQWLEFAALLASNGYRVLTFNRRGTCPGEALGCSAGTATGNGWKDLGSAVAVLRDIGSRRIVVGGASLGAMESLYALSRGLDADGLIWVSGFDFYGLTPVARQVRDVKVPKLFIAGEFDVDAAVLVPTLERASPPPKEAVILATGEHGTDILAHADPAVADEFRRSVLDFLRAIEQAD